MVRASNPMQEKRTWETKLQLRTHFWGLPVLNTSFAFPICYSFLRLSFSYSTFTVSNFRIYLLLEFKYSPLKGFQPMWDKKLFRPLHIIISATSIFSFIYLFFLTWLFVHINIYPLIKGNFTLSWVTKVLVSDPGEIKVNNFLWGFGLILISYLFFFPETTAFYW